MKAEARRSEDELLVQAIHKTMGQMEQLKQTCLRLSVNADAELALFMRETERLLERVQSPAQEAVRQEPERARAVQASTLVKKTIRPAAAYVAERKLAYASGKSSRFLQRRSEQVIRKRTSRKKRGRTSGVRAANEHKRPQRSQSKPTLQTKFMKEPVELQQPKRSQSVSTAQPGDYLGIRTSSNLKRSL